MYHILYWALALSGFILFYKNAKFRKEHNGASSVKLQLLLYTNMIAFVAAAHVALNSSHPALNLAKSILDTILIALSILMIVLAVHQHIQLRRTKQP